MKYRFRTTPIQPTDLAYIAGIVDGEGTVSGPNRMQLRIFNTSVELMEYLYSVTGIKCTERKEIDGTFYSNKPLYIWRVCGLTAFYILYELYPYMVIKAAKTLEVLEAHRCPNRVYSRQVGERLAQLEKLGWKLAYEIPI